MQAPASVIAAAYSYRIAKRIAQREASIPVADWIEQNAYLYDTGAPMTLFPFQREALAEALRKDANGLYVYDTVVWSWPKKSGKSSLLAGLAHYVARTRPNGSVKIMGNDQKQADSREMAMLRDSIRVAQKSGRDTGIKIKPSGYKVEYPNGSVVEAIPVDPEGESGGNDDLLIFGEIWGWRHKVHERMWSELTLSPLRYGKSQRWIGSYAGVRGQSPVLEHLYNVGVNQGRRISDTLEMYANEAARQLTIWVTEGLFPWHTPEYYASEAAIMTEGSFLRIHRNQWADDGLSFVPVEWWDSCQGALPELGQYQQVVIGMDAAVSGDCFAMVAVSRDKHERHLHLRALHVWYPPKGGKITFSNPNNPDDPTTPEGVLRDWARRWRVAEVAYDEYQLHDFCTRLQAQGAAYFRPFPQGSDRLMADKQLYDIIREGRITHGGYPEMSDHIRGAAAKSADESRLRIVKATDTSKIDLVVALSMAADRALYLNIG